MTRAPSAAEALARTYYYRMFQFIITLQDNNSLNTHCVDTLSNLRLEVCPRFVLYKVPLTSTSYPKYSFVWWCFNAATPSTPTAMMLQQPSSVSMPTIHPVQSSLHINFILQFFFCMMLFQWDKA